MRRIMITFTLIGVIGMIVFPATAQNPTAYPVISPENVSQLTQIDRLGQGTVNDGEWSPNGEWLAIGGGAGVWLYDSNFEVVDLLEGSATVVEWTPDSQQIVTLHGRLVQFWDIGTRQIVREFEYPAAGSPRTFSLSPDASQFAIAGGRTVRILDGQSGEVLHELEGHPGTPTALDWSPDGAMLVSGGTNSTTIVWDSATGEALYTATWESSIQAVSWSPNSDRWAFAVYDVSIRIRVIDGATGDIVFEEEVTDGSGDLAWSPDGTKLAVAHRDLTVWDIDTAAIEFVSTVFSPAQVRWSPNGEYLMTLRQYLAQIRDAHSGVLIMDLPDYGLPALNIAWSSNGDYLAVRTDFRDSEQLDLTVWDVATHTIMLHQKHWSVVNNVHFTPAPDGEFLTFVQYDEATREGVLEAWNPETDTVTELRRGDLISSSFSWSPDGQYFAFSGSGYDGLSITNAISQTAIYFDDHSGRNMWWSPDSTYLAYFSDMLNLYHLSSDSLQQFPMETFSGVTVVWSPDSSYFLAYFNREWFQITAQTGDLQPIGDSTLHLIAFSPDSSLIAIADRDTITFHTTPTSDAIFTFEPSDNGNISAFAFSPDGTILALAQEDGTVTLWAVQE